MIGGVHWGLEGAMDADQADRLIVTYLQAVQAWERAQVLMADGVALCEAALEACDRAATLRLPPPTVPRSCPPARPASG